MPHHTKINLRMITDNHSFNIALLPNATVRASLAVALNQRFPERDTFRLNKKCSRFQFGTLNILKEAIS
jgi:hypothetical protein